MVDDSLHASHSQRMVDVFDTVHYTATSAPGSYPLRHGMYDIPKPNNKKFRNLNIAAKFSSAVSIFWILDSEGFVSWLLSSGV